jgi:hypothetical protein
MGLIVGIPLIVLTLSLLSIFRAERRRRKAGIGTPASWMPLYRGVAVALLVLVAVEVVGLVLGALNGRPPTGPGT